MQKKRAADAALWVFVFLVGVFVSRLQGRFWVSFLWVVFMFLNFRVGFLCFQPFAV